MLKRAIASLWLVSDTVAASTKSTPTEGARMLYCFDGLLVVVDDCLADGDLARELVQVLGTDHHVKRFAWAG